MSARLRRVWPMQACGEDRAARVGRPDVANGAAACVHGSSGLTCAPWRMRMRVACKPPGADSLSTTHASCMSRRAEASTMLRTM